jgi:hypothetical protein
MSKRLEGLTMNNIEARALNLPEGKKLYPADSYVTEYLINHIKDLEAKLDIAVKALEYIVKSEIDFLEVDVCATKALEKIGETK